VDLTYERAGQVAPDQAEDGERVIGAPTGGPAQTLTGRRARAVVVGLLAVAIFVRFASWSHLWLDEALSVNLARLPLGDIPDALRHDGSPPLYYVLLHGWMKVFGDGVFAVRALSGLCSLAVIPLAWLAGMRLGGRRLAWAAVVLLAANPFAARYATEARMYSLVMVLVLAGFIAAHDLLQGGGRRPAVVLGLMTGLALLTHYWCFYLLAVTLVALVRRARRATEPARTGARRALVAMGAGCLLFLPWVPIFLYQLGHTGTPWGKPGEVRSVFDTVTHFAGGYWNPGIILGLVFFGLVVLGLFGRPVDDRRILLELRPRSPGRDLAVLAFGTLVVAVLAGRLGDSAFAVRYAAVIFPFVILLVAAGTQVFTDRRVHNGALAVAVVLSMWACIPNIVGERTGAPRVAAALEANAQPGDVVAYCPDQLGPSVGRELDASGLVQLTFPRATGPEVVDWVDYAATNRAARTADFARMLVDRAGPDHDVWLVWAPGYRTFSTKCQNLIDRLDDLRPDNDRVVKVPTRYFERPGLVQFRPGS
jgi:hypothetical protein